MHGNWKTIHLIFHGQQCQRHGSRARGRTNDEVAQRGGHTPASRSTEACSLGGLQHISLILDIQIWVKSGYPLTSIT